MYLRQKTARYQRRFDPLTYANILPRPLLRRRRPSFCLHRHLRVVSKAPMVRLVGELGKICPTVVRREKIKCLNCSLSFQLRAMVPGVQGARACLERLLEVEQRPGRQSRPR